MTKRATPEEISAMGDKRVRTLVQQALDHEDAKRKRFLKKAMDKLPKDTEETICGVCGDQVVPRIRAISCNKCKAPVCDLCFKRAVSTEKAKFQWQHAIEAKGKCLHPKHPKCSNQAVMKKVRAKAKENLECEACEYVREKEEEAQYNGASQPLMTQDTEFTPYNEESDEDEEERPITQPNSPLPPPTHGKEVLESYTPFFRCGNEEPSSPPATPGKEEDDAMSDNEDPVIDEDKIFKEALALAYVGAGFDGDGDTHH